MLEEVEIIAHCINKKHTTHDIDCFSISVAKRQKDETFNWDIASNCKEAAVFLVNYTSFPIGRKSESTQQKSVVNLCESDHVSSSYMACDTIVYTYKNNNNNNEKRLTDFAFVDMHINGRLMQ